MPGAPGTVLRLILSAGGEATGAPGCSRSPGAATCRHGPGVPPTRREGRRILPEGPAQAPRPFGPRDEPPRLLGLCSRS